MSQQEGGSGIGQQFITEIEDQNNNNGTHTTNKINWSLVVVADANAGLQAYTEVGWMGNFSVLTEMLQ